MSRADCNVREGRPLGTPLQVQLQGVLTRHRVLSAVAAGNEVQLLRKDNPGYAGFALPMWGESMVQISDSEGCATRE